MRVFLTYVYAALAAAICVTLILSGPWYVEMFAGIFSGDYRALAALNPLIELGFRWGGYLIALGVLSFAASYMFGAQRVFSNVWISVAVCIVFAMIAFVIAQAGYVIVTGAEFDSSTLSSATTWGEFFIAGVAWGTIFWLRQPKQSQSMEAAA